MHAGSLIVTSILGAACHYKYIFDNPYTKNKNRVVLEQVMEQVKNKWKMGCSTCRIQSAWRSTVIGKAKFDEVEWVTIRCRVTDMYIMKHGMMKLQCGLGNRILDYERRVAIR